MASSVVSHAETRTGNLDGQYNYEGPGKKRIRAFISECVPRYLNSTSPADAVWLANDRFTDVPESYGSVGSVTVVENDVCRWAEKRRQLRQRKTDFIELHPQPINMQEFLSIANRVFHVANMDFCSHFSPWVYCAIDRFLRQVPQHEKGILFMTVARRSRLTCRGLWHGFISCDYSDIKGFVEQKALDQGAVLRDLSPNDLREYDSNAKPGSGCRMFFYAWEVEKRDIRRRYNEKKQQN